MNIKTAIITGGTGGIGSAICQRLAADHQVIACYYKNGRHEEARQWQALQKAAGINVDIIYGDVANFNDCEQIVSLVMERYGQIDILVNNAGITQDS
jgi:acetoacetyl-CoA reductase